MRVRPNKKLLLILLLPLLLLGLLLPQHAARAVELFCPASLTQCFTDLGATIISSLGQFLSWVAQKLAAFIQPSYQADFLQAEPVHKAWGIMRDFVNMFFILFLIIMAFGTIFDISGWNYQSLLRPFLIAAILLNFSYPLAQFFIGLGNGLAAVFLNTIGTANFGARLMDGLGLTKFLTSNGSTLLSGVSGVSIFASIIFTIIFTVIALFAMAAAFIFSLIRIPVLWFLLVLSPAAVVCSVLPSTKSMWTSWRKNFVAWVFFLPIYLFFLMFAFIFIASKQAVTVPDAATGGFGTLFGLNDIFYYVLTIIFLIYGLERALTIGKNMDAGMGKLAVGIHEGVKKYTGKYSGYTGFKEGAKQGLTETGERIAEKGVFGIGGQQAARLRQAGVAELFGARGAKDKQVQEETAKQRKEFEKTLRTDAELQKTMQSGSAVERMAAGEMLRDRFALNGPQMVAMQNLIISKGAPLAAQKFMRGVTQKQFEQLKEEDRRLVIENTIDPEVIKNVLMAMAERGDLKNAEITELEKYTKMLGKFTDQLDFLTKIQKQNFERSVELQAKLKMVKDQNGQLITDREGAIKYKARTMNLDAFFELAPTTIERLLTDSEINRIIGARLNKGVLESLPGKLDSVRLEIMDTLVGNRRKEEIKTEETQRLNEQAEAQARGMKPLVDSINELINSIRNRP